jgi:signal transduction histidine kinase
MRPGQQRAGTAISPANCKRTTRGHRGSMALEPKLGEGTKITVSLPIMQLVEFGGRLGV